MNHAQAYDEMLSMLKEGWDPTGFPLYYEAVDVEKSVANDANGRPIPFAKVWIRHNQDQAQRTLGGLGNRQFERRGTIEVMVHSPTGKGLSDSYALAKVAADIFEGKKSPGGIWFRRVRITEQGDEGPHYRMSMLADFTYTEVK